MGSRLFRLVRIAAGFVLLALAVVWVALSSPWGVGSSGLADLVSRSASSPDMKLGIGAIEGLLSSNPVVRDIVVADKDGAWLKIDRVAVDWSRLSLFTLMLDIDRVDVGAIEVLRRPVSSESKKDAGGGGSMFPDLPFRLRIGEVALGKIALAEPVLGASAALAASAGADVGATKDGAKLWLKAKRLDAPGAFSMNAEFARGAQQLKLAVDMREPAGGLIARLAGIAGAPPVEIVVTGEGPLDAFEANLSASAGERVGARGGARIVRSGAARRMEIVLTGEIAPLLPEAIGALFAGSTSIAGSAALGDDGALALDRATLSAAAFRLDLSGKLDAARNVDARLALRGQPPEEGVAFRARTLTGDMTVKGSLTRPDAALRLLVEDAQFAAGRFERIDLDVKALADAPLGDPAAHIDVNAQARGVGLAFENRELAEAIGDSATLSLRARATGAGDADVSLARIETRAGEASFAGKAGPGALKGRATVSAPDLRRFARLAGRDLRGALTLAADLAGSPREGRVAATLDGAVASPAVGLAAVDGLVGRRLALSGKIETTPGGGVSFDKLSLRGDHVQAAVNGAATRERAAIDASLAVADLSRADARVAGRADLRAKLTGSLEKPDAVFEAVLSGASASGRAIPRLALTGDAHELTGALRADLALDGTIDGKRALGKASLARAGKGFALDDVDIDVGRAAVKGALALDAAGIASGRLSLDVPDLDDLSALALQELAGSLHADIVLEAASGGQNLSVDARGAKIRASEAALERLSAKFSARDLYRRPLLDGEAAIDNARVGQETISKVRVTARPSGAGAALDLSVNARGFDVSGNAVVTPGERTRVDIASLAAQRAGKRLALAGPAVVSFGDGVVELRGASIAAGTGRLDVDGTIADRLDLTVRARAVPLSVASIADSSLDLAGVLDAEAHIVGEPKAPAGDWRVKLAKLSAPQLRTNGLPALDVAASGKLSGARTSLDADIAAGGSSKLKISGSAPIDGAGGLDLAVKGLLDLALANSALAAGGQTVGGKANVDLRLAGPVKAPVVSGDVTLSGGTFNDPLNGVNLVDISGKIAGKGRELDIVGLTAQTKNGGKIGVMGRVSVDPEQGMPASLRIASRNALLANTDIVFATADLDLAISGPLVRAPKVSGRVKLVSTEIGVPDRVPANLRPLPGSSHIDAKGFAAQMLALERKQKAKAGRSSNFDAALDLAISAPNRIFVRGRGIDAEFSGELKLQGSVQKPTVVGAFDLRRGKLQLLTQRIDISHGRLGFTSGLTPQLDFSAETSAADVTARIGISGPADAPVFSFSSTPELPQDEVLSRLLFAKASGSLTPFQAVQLAAALAQFSGAATGVDAFEKMRRALGVDSLDLEAGGAGGPTVGASRYIMDGVNVGVRTGSKPEQTAVNVGVDVTRGVRVQSETRVDGKTSVGVGVEFEY